jgi:hypothetical protein
MGKHVWPCCRKGNPMKKLAIISVATLSLTVARAANPPELKEGLWEIHGQSLENPGNRKTDFTYRLCRNHAYDKAMDALVKNVKGCTTAFDNVGGGKYTSASRCTVEGTVIESKGSYTYESSTSTRSESHATYTPPLRGKSEETVLQDQTYLGNCPAGMNPGDRIKIDAAPAPNAN